MASPRVLFVAWSQTGMLYRIVDSVAAPLREAGIGVQIERLEPRQPFPFPWPLLPFVDCMPEAAAMEGCEIEPVELEGDFDLVILAYTVWFLAPSLPITGFLRSDAARRLLRDRPVVTLIGCRNMWLMAQEKMKARLAELGARLIDNVVLVDKGPPVATLYTTPRWLLTGRRESRHGLAPAGVSDEDIAAASRFGVGLAQGILDGRAARGETLLEGLGAAPVDERFIASEKAGTRVFGIWSRLLRLAGGRGARVRRPLAALFAVYLITAIPLVVPITLVLRRLLLPLVRGRLAEQRAYFELPSGR